MPKKNFDIKSSDCTKIVFARSYNMSSSIALEEGKKGEESKEKNPIRPASESEKGNIETGELPGKNNISVLEKKAGIANGDKNNNKHPLEKKCEEAIRTNESLFVVDLSSKKKKTPGKRASGQFALSRLADTKGQYPKVLNKRKTWPIKMKIDKMIAKDGTTVPQNNDGTKPNHKEGKENNHYCSPTTRSSVASFSERDINGDNDRNTNIIINYNDFTDMIRDNFVCRFCKSSVTSCNIRKSTIGVATTINYQCSNEKCKNAHVINPETTERMTQENEWKFLGNNYFDKKGKRHKRYIGTFSINLRLVLWMQQFGLSKTATQQLASILGLTSYSNTFDNFSELEEHIGLFQIALSEMIIQENLDEEISKSPLRTVNGVELADLSTSQPPVPARPCWPSI